MSTDQRFRVSTPNGIVLATKRNVYGKYNCYSSDGKQSLQFDHARCLITKSVGREQEEYVCRAANMPYEVVADTKEAQDLYSKYNLNAEHAIQVPFGSTQINVLTLENESRPSVYIATNQMLDARQSKFNGQFRQVNFADLFLNCIANIKFEANIVENLGETAGNVVNFATIYFEECVKKPIGSMDCWFVCQSCKSENPEQDDDVLTYGYSIDPNGNIFKNVDLIRLTKKLEKFDQINDENRPMSFLIFNEPHVNAKVFKVVNCFYKNLKMVLNNHPDIVKRFLTLMHFVYLDNDDEIQDYIRLEYVKFERKEPHMNRIVAREYLHRLAQYNPSVALFTIFGLYKVVEKVEFNAKHSKVPNHLINWVRYDACLKQGYSRNQLFFKVVECRDSKNILHVCSRDPIFLVCPELVKIVKYIRRFGNVKFFSNFVCKFEKYFEYEATGIEHHEIVELILNAISIASESSNSRNEYEPCRILLVPKEEKFEEFDIMSDRQFPMLE